MTSDISPLMRAALSGQREPPPSARALGHTAFVELRPGYARSRFVAREEFRTPFGVTHGGFLAAVLDDVMGQAVATLLAAGDTCASTDISVRFLEAVSPGATLIAEGQVLRRERAVIHAEGTLMLESGTPARGSSGFVLLPGADPGRSEASSQGTQVTELERPIDAPLGEDRG